MARTLIFNILLVITFEVFMFLNGQKKYRGYVTLKHYVLTLKMPLYQKVLFDGKNFSCFLSDNFISNIVLKKSAHIIMSHFFIFMKNYCSVYVKNKKNT